MRRREFIAGLGSAAAWPLVARAQQSERMRRIGVLRAAAESDPDSKVRAATVREALQQLGWIEGRNLSIEWRWAADDADLLRSYAAELVKLGLDAILTEGPGLRPLQQITRTIPIVFAGGADPVDAGLVESLARPRGNITGFAGVESGQNTKFLELLKEIVPGITRVAILGDLTQPDTRVGVLGNPTQPDGSGNRGSIQGVIAALRVEVRLIDTRDADAIERGVSAFARDPNGGLIVPPSGFATLHRESIIKVAARYRLPAVYPDRIFAADGGLVSYGSNPLERLRSAAGYIDRIFRGEKPADLPVQLPIKYETVLNLKTAKALGIEVPTSVLLRADEVIE